MGTYPTALVGLSTTYYAARRRTSSITMPRVAMKSLAWQPETPPASDLPKTSRRARSVLSTERPVSFARREDTSCRCCSVVRSMPPR